MHALRKGRQFLRISVAVGVGPGITWFFSGLLKMEAGATEPDVAEVTFGRSEGAMSDRPRLGV